MVHMDDFCSPNGFTNTDAAVYMVSIFVDQIQRH